MNRLVSAFVVGLLLAAGVAAPATGQLLVENADLTIDQPHYVGQDVSRQSANGTVVYEARGSELQIAPSNFDTGSVTEFAVATGPGDLSYDKQLGVYEFSPSEDGTYEVYWLVQEQRTVNGTTQQVTVRYAARIRVSGTDLQHVPAGTQSATDRAAANWSEFESAVKSERVAGEDANIDDVTQTAINLLRLKYHPLSALTGDFTGLLLALTLSLSGLVILLLATGAHLFSRYKDITERRRRQKLDRERVELEDELDAIDEHKRQSKLAGMDWNDIFDDATARAFRDHLGETVLDGYLTIQNVLDVDTLVADRLQAMADTHVAVWDQRPTRTDGGTDTAGTGTAHLEPRGSVAEDADTADLADPADELLAAIDFDDPELREFELAAAADHGDLGLDVDGLVENLDVDLRQDFEDRETFVQYLTEFLQTVVDHEYTDEDGRVRPLRHALNLWLRALRFVGEREGVPTAKYQADHVAALLETYDRESEISEFVNRVETGQEGV